MTLTDSIEAMPTPHYWIQDRKTLCYWAEGRLFYEKQKAENMRMELVRKYRNPDLRVVSR